MRRSNESPPDSAGVVACPRGGGGGQARLFVCLGVLAFALFVADLTIGTTHIPLRDVWQALTGRATDAMTGTIVIEIRLMKSLTAILVGVALSISGLQMQTLFRNPLAGPYVLGISSGAALGVALFLLGMPLLGWSWIGGMGVLGAAWIGAFAILAVIAVVSRRVGDVMVVLILGILFSSGVSAVVEILQFLSNESALKSYVVWTMGSLGEVTLRQMPILAGAIAAGVALSAVVVKPLNILLLGEEYAQTMGIRIRRTQTLIFLSTTLLAGTATAFCGPIGFVGLAVPHVARMLFRTADHRVLLPASALIGTVMMLACDLISKSLALPINSITALLGIPIVVWVVFRHRTVA